MNVVADCPVLPVALPASDELFSDCCEPQFFFHVDEVLALATASEKVETRIMIDYHVPGCASFLYEPASVAEIGFSPSLILPILLHIQTIAGWEARGWLDLHRRQRPTAVPMGQPKPQTAGAHCDSHGQLSGCEGS